MRVRIIYTHSTWYYIKLYTSNGSKHTLIYHIECVLRNTHSMWYYNRIIRSRLLVAIILEKKKKKKKKKNYTKLYTSSAYYVIRMSMRTKYILNPLYRLLSDWCITCIRIDIHIHTYTYIHIRTHTHAYAVTHTAHNILSKYLPL